jgi:predicted  nucleic acid-binding Zn-ribbon protein
MQLINDSQAVKKMAADTEHIIKELEQSLKSVEQEISSINTRWKDQNYLNLKKMIEDRKMDLENLLKELISFKQWLDVLYKRLYEYENVQKLK